MATRCPAGHLSTEPDYCSVCGAPLPALSSPSPPPARASGNQLTASCPLCREPCAPLDPHCPLCGYALHLAPLPPVASADAARTVARLLISVDPSIDDEPEPDAPLPLHPPFEVALARDETLVGRHDPQQIVGPEVPVRDPGASRRHALVIRESDALWLVDLGSTNGTRLNGAPLSPHARSPLRPGDHVTLGRWTRIIVK